MRRILNLGIALGLFFTASLSVKATAEPAFQKVLIVIFENTDYTDAVRQPFFAQLAKDGALLQNMYAEAHPSQGNYIALVSGALNGVTSDSNKTIDVPHLGDLLEAKGLTWKVYAESYPGNCFKGAKSGTYVRKHNPFISFKNIQDSPNRCARIVNSLELDSDISAGTLANFSLYIPDLNNDGHDTDVRYADNWYSKAFGPRLRDRKFMDGMILISTFDESSLTSNNQIYTSLVGSGVIAGKISKVPYNHYSILRTIEDAFGLGNLEKLDAKASPIADIWQ